MDTPDWDSLAKPPSAESAAPTSVAPEAPSEETPDWSSLTPSPNHSESVPEWDDLKTEQDQSHTLGDTAEAVVHGFRQGILGPIAALESKYLPDTGGDFAPEQEAKISENHPLARGVGEVAGLVSGPIGAGIGKLGTMAGEASELGSVGSAAIKGAIEGGLFQGSDEVSKSIMGHGDPNDAVSSALGNIGAAALLGGGLGGSFGYIGQGLKALAATKASQAAADHLHEFGARWSLPSEAELATENLGSRTLPKLKDNAQEIMESADRLDVPVLNGMVSGDKAVQMGEDALLNGPPTVASIARQNAYSNAFDKVSNAVDTTLGGAEGTLTETQAGNALKSSLIDKIEAENAPIKAMYDALGDYKQAIPVTPISTNRISQNIMKIIDDQGLIKGTPEYNFVQTMADGMDQITSLDKLANFRTALGRATDPNTRFVSGVIKEKLDNLEENAIKRYADTMKSKVAKDKINGLIDQVSKAKGAYSEFRGKLQELGNAVGKKKIYGPQDFMDFVGDMNPQSLTKKLFNENNTEFAQWFSKEFPEEFSTMRNYQRGQLRLNATKNEVFDPRALVKSVVDPKAGMEPEMQKLLFNPDELKKLSDAKTYLGSFPSNFNPSGTSHMSAFRSFFESPTGAAIGNARDFAIKNFVVGKDMNPKVLRAMGRTPTPGTSAAAMRVLSEGKPEHMYNALTYAEKAEQGAQAINNGVSSLFKKGSQQAWNAHAIDKDNDKLKNYIESGQQNEDIQKQIQQQGIMTPKAQNFAEGGHVKSQEPKPILKNNSGLSDVLPEHAMLLNTAKGRINSYLNSIRPIPNQRVLPFDNETSNSDKARSYDRAISIANQPLSVLNNIQKGTLTSEHVKHFTSLYPELHGHLSKKITQKLTEKQMDEEKPSYRIRQGLSLFMGTPLDSTMTPQSIQSVQAMYALKSNSATQGASQKKQSKNTNKIGEASKDHYTLDQASAKRATEWD